MTTSKQQPSNAVDRLPRWLVLSLIQGLIEETKEGQQHEQH